MPRIVLPTTNAVDARASTADGNDSIIMLKLLSLLCFITVVVMQPAAAQIATENLSTADMPAPSTSHVFVHDMSFAHIIDGRVVMLDARTGKIVSFFSTGYMGQFALTEDRKTLLASAGYFSRLIRGDRTDVLQVFDLSNHSLKGEILLPPRRAQALPYRGLMEVSADGKRVYVQNANPGSSVTVVDLPNMKVLGEVGTPGCWAILPASAGHTRFSTICGDGKVLTVTLDDAGQVVDQQRSTKFFDVDDDPLFIQGERVDATYHFISFQGVLHTLNLDAAQPKILGAQPLMPARGKVSGWRPGGYQPFAIDPHRQRLYMLVHPRGREGSHKAGAREIWGFDLSTRALVQRMPASGEIALTLTKDPAPLLLTLEMEKQRLNVYDPERKKLVRSIAKAGETSTRLEAR